MSELTIIGNDGKEIIIEQPAAIEFEISPGGMRGAKGEQGDVGPIGPQGPVGPAGPTGVYIGPSAPDDTSVVWADIDDSGNMALDGKVDKVAVANRGYTTDGSGGQTTLPLSTGSAANSIAIRDANGRTGGADATSNGQYVTKGQMDTADALKVNKAGDIMTGPLSSSATSVGYGQNRGGVNNLFGTSSTGNFLVYNGTSGTELMNVMSNGSGIRLGTSTGIGAPIIGTGFPNGVVSAPVASTYIDTAATNGAIEWKKASGTGNTGWVVSVGSLTRIIEDADLLDGWVYTNPVDKPRLIRNGNTVTLSIRYYTLDGSAATSTNFLTVPNGFRPAIVGNYGLIGMLAHSLGSVPKPLLKNFGMIQVERNTSGASVGGMVTWQTTDAWPAA